MNKSCLYELFPVEDQQAINNQKKVLLFDMHNTAYRTLFSAIFMNPSDNENFYFWRHLFINSLFTTINKFNPEKVIFAFDTKGSWRHDHFDKYKNNRKQARDKAVVDFDKFYPVFNELKDEMKETFSTIYTIEYPRAEADDIIAVLVKEQFKSSHNIIVSSDKDLHQLLINKNNQQFDPIKNKIVKCINPQKELDIKVITGDKSDTIPAIKPRTGKATAEAILKKGLSGFIDENEEIKNNYMRNRILIDFNFIPKELTKGILKIYNDYKIKDIDSSKLMKFFSRNKLRKLMDDWSNFGPLIKSLK